MLVAAAALVACGDGEGPRSAGGGQDARALLERGFATKVDSGVIDVKVDITVKDGTAPQLPLHIDADGPFDHGSTSIPRMELELYVSGYEGEGGATFTVTDDNAYVEYMGAAYELGRDVWRKLLESDAPRADAIDGLNPLAWITDERVVGEDTLSGVSTVKVAGTIDLRKAGKQLNALARSIPGEAPLTKRQMEIWTQMVGDELAFTAWIGEDGIWRRFTAELDASFAPEESSRMNGMKGGRFRVDVRLDDPNEPVKIRTPADARPITSLLQQLGIDPSVLLGPGAQLPVPG